MSTKLPEGWMDWNTLTLDQMVDYLREKHMFSSSGESLCIHKLIEFYDRNKWIDRDINHPSRIKK